MDKPFLKFVICLSDIRILTLLPNPNDQTVVAFKASLGSALSTGIELNINNPNVLPSILSFFL